MTVTVAAAERHLHVPVPGELVSPASGSALPTVSRALGSALIAAGGGAGVLARAGMAHDTRPLELLEFPMGDRVWLGRGAKVADAVLGAGVGRRPWTDRLWAPVYDAVPATHGGAVFLYNAPAAAAGLRRHRPQSRPVVYLQNEIAQGWPARARRRLIDTTPVVCVSRFVAERLVPGAADAGRILTLLNGADPAQFHPAHDEPEPTVLFVGKVSPHKGPDLLIEAAGLLREQGLRFRVLIVGGAELSAQGGLSDFERRLRVRAADLGGMVEFRPFVDRHGIADVYRSATIMVVPSNWDEPCALTLPEAMASGLACVTSRRGGLPEVGADAALYFDPRDVVGLADRLRVLLSDEDERRARAAAALQRAGHLTWASRLTALTDWLARWQPS